MVYGVAHPRLGGQIHHHVEMVFLKKALHQPLVADGAFDKNMLCPGTAGGLFYQLQPVFLQGRVVVSVHIVQADDPATCQVLQQPQHQIGPYEAGGAGDQNVFAIQIYFLHLNLS